MWCNAFHEKNVNDYMSNKKYHGNSSRCKWVIDYTMIIINHATHRKISSSECEINVRSAILERNIFSMVGKEGRKEGGSSNIWRKYSNKSNLPFHHSTLILAINYFGFVLKVNILQIKNSGHHFWLIDKIYFK